MTTAHTGVHAGAAEGAITPPVGIELLEPRGTRATGIHDDLCVRALALECQGQAAVVVTMDLLGLDLMLVDRVRTAVEARTGLAAERLMLTASHTHSAPVTINWGRSAQERRDQQWEARLVSTTAEVVAQAMQATQPASLACGRAPIQIGFNRRLSNLSGTDMLPNRHGAVAPFVDVLRVDRQDGSSLALLYSHAAHAVTIHTAGTEIASDFPGGAARRIRQLLGPEVVPMFAQGCGADINVHPLRGGYSEAERVGGQLGEAAVQAARDAAPIRPTCLACVSRSLVLPFEPLPAASTEAVLERAHEGYLALEEGNASEQELYNQRELVLWAERMRDWAACGTMPTGLPFEVQGLALGPELVLLGLTHEVFVAYQLYLQAHSPFAHSMVFGYANGCGDYVPTAEAFALGGYEVNIAHKLYGWPALQPDCERLVKAAAMEVLSTLHAQSQRK
jgi:neutral ceramidase